MRIVFKDMGEVKGLPRTRVNTKSETKKGRVYNPEWVKPRKQAIEALFFKQVQEETDLCANCPKRGKCFLEKFGYRDPKMDKKLYEKLYPCLPVFGDDPVRVLLNVSKKMPAKSWSKKKKYENEGKPAPVKPDSDNIVKLYLDALNGVAYRDDDHVTALIIQKRYGWNDSVRALIEPDGGFNVIMFVWEYLMKINK